ncbi:MAG: nucleoside hydrolase [Spirochaetaceae bacterium]|nr:nucleoside hydrolase [Spirochaetaceae bacterium]
MTRIIIDCDPGHDDMMAIMLATASDKIDLLGITTVAGNQTGDKTFENALRILTLINEEFPVARGADKPLLRELVTAPQFHGQSGLDGAELPEPGIKHLNIDAVDFIINMLNESIEKITLVPTGPLTNIAMVLLKNPEIKNKIERIVLMGGGMHDSNVTPAAEFNIYVDPEAAKIVFESGVPITMVGLDVTNKALMSFEEIEGIISDNGRISSKVGPLLKFFANANKKIFGLNGAPIHDALAIAAVIDPSVIITKFLNVQVEVSSELTRGATVVDIYGATGKNPNADVALEVDTPRFVGFMLDSIKKLDKKFA